MRRVRVVFLGHEVELVNRDAAIRQIERLAERGTQFPLIIYGPEGCGKTALLRQAKTILEEHGYYVVYVNPLAERTEEMLQYTPSIRDVVLDALKLTPEPFSRIVDVAISVASLVMERFSRTRIAILMDDVFQATGVDRAEQYVKALLNLIEWPPTPYERIVALAVSSEGVTRRRVGRHDWAELRMMWNMPKSGFEELYNLLPSPKPHIEDAWRLTGGNPRILERLHVAEWSVDAVVEWLAASRSLDDFINRLTGFQRDVLREAVDDVDALARRLREAEEWDEKRGIASLIDGLIELNMITSVDPRSPNLWIDEPPPEKDPELGIGRYYAWQTPLHREAVKRALGIAARD